MDVLANYSIFQELQLVHDTGYFSAMPSLEENWQQVSADAFSLLFRETERGVREREGNWDELTCARCFFGVLLCVFLVFCISGALRRGSSRSM